MWGCCASSARTQRSHGTSAGEAGVTPPWAGQGAALVAFPEGCSVGGQRVGAATLDWNGTMTGGCENRAKRGSLEGAALLAPAAEQASMSPGKDGEGSAHTQDSWPRRVSKSQTPKLWQPSGASSYGGAYAETTSTQTPLECLPGTGSPQAGGPGDSDRPELEAALLWGCLWDSPRIPVLPMGLPQPARSEQSLPRGTGLGILCWGHPMAVLHLSLPHSVLCAHSSPLLNSPTLTSSLSNPLYHQPPSHITTAKPSLPCRLLLLLAERQRTLGRRNKGWEERGKEPGKSFTPHRILPLPRAG